MSYCFPREGSRATAVLLVSGALERRGYSGSDLGVTELISFKVEVGFSTQSMNEKSGGG